MDVRRLFVITNVGEDGPFDRLELVEQLRLRRIKPDDRLRTASGRAAGTVASFIAEIAPEEPPPEPPRPTRAATVAKEEAVAVTASTRRLWVLAVGVVGLVALALVLPWLRSAVSTPLERPLPVATLTAEPASWALGMDGALIVRIDQPTSVPVIVPLEYAGSAVAGVDLLPLPEELVILAGAISARIPVHPLPVTAERNPAVTLTATLASGGDWRRGEPHVATITCATLDSHLPTDPPLTWLDEMTFAGTWNWSHALGRRRSFDDNPLIINGTQYARGLGMHAGTPKVDPESFVIVPLGGRYQVFMAEVGIDDEAKSENGVSFQVWLDGQPQFDSGIMRSEMPPKLVRVDIAGGRELRLVIRAGGETNRWAHADWGGARLIGQAP